MSQDKPHSQHTHATPHDKPHTQPSPKGYMKKPTPAPPPTGGGYVAPASAKLPDLKNIHYANGSVEVFVVARIDDQNRASGHVLPQPGNPRGFTADVPEWVEGVPHGTNDWEWSD